jgi:sugar lactone lactonase YvrE
VLVDPDGENIHSMVIQGDEMYVTTTSPPYHTSDDLAVVRVDEGSIERVATNLPFPEGVDVGPDGALYTACWNDRAVHRSTLEGADEAVYVGDDYPTNLLFGPDGSLYVNNWYASTIDRVSPDGSRALFSSHEEYAGPHGMTWDDQGRLFVANFLDGKVFLVDEDGGAELFARLPYDSTLGHLVFLDGSFYATAADLNQVYRISAEGEVSVFAGSGYDDDLDGAPEEAAFSAPNGLVADPERHLLYVAMDSTLKVITLGFE